MNSIPGKIFRTFLMIVLGFGIVAILVCRFPTNSSYTSLCADIGDGKVKVVDYYLESFDVKVLWFDGLGPEKQAVFKSGSGLLGHDPVGDLENSLMACRHGQPVKLKEQDIWTDQGLLDPLILPEYIGYIPSSALQILVFSAYGLGLVLNAVESMCKVPRAGRWFFPGLIIGIPLLYFLAMVPDSIFRKGKRMSISDLHSGE